MTIVHSRFKIHENSAWYVVVVVRLVKEHVLSISGIGGPLFKNAIVTDAVFGTEALPVDRAHFIAALPKLKGDDFSRHGGKWVLGVRETRVGSARRVGSVIGEEGSTGFSRILTSIV
jgi:hypothetical protein